MIEANLVPNPEEPEGMDLHMKATAVVDLAGLTNMECVVYGIGLLRRHLSEALDVLEEALDMGNDPDVPISMMRDLLDTLQITASGGPN